MEIFSHSKLSTFEQCKLKYKFKYIDKIAPQIEKSIEAHLGSTVHKALEWLHTTIKDEKRTPSIDELIVYYTNTWKSEYKPEMPIVKDGLTAKDYFNKGVQFLINYYIEHQPFKDNTLEIEKEVYINLDEEGNYKIRGFIDRVVHDIEKEEYEIHDYKTAGSLPSKDKIENDRQLALYSIAIKESLPDSEKHKEVSLVWHYLSFNKKIKSKRTEEQLKNLRKQTLELIKEIKSTTHFPPTKSSLCEWCEYKPICPVWKNKPQKITEKQSSIGEFSKKEEIID